MILAPHQYYIWHPKSYLQQKVARVLATYITSIDFYELRSVSCIGQSYFSRQSNRGKKITPLSML